MLDEKIRLIGKEIFQLVRNSKTSFFDKSFWSSKLMELGMKDEKLKVELFRFVDVLPVLNSDDELVKHIQEYFGNFKGEHSDLIQTLTQISSGSFIGKMAASAAIKTGVMQMAKTFIAGSNFKEISQKALELRKRNMSFTVDILGEAVLSEKEAFYYQKLYLDLISSLAGESKKWDDHSLIDNSPHGFLPKVNISVKLSSLYSQIDVLGFENSVIQLKEKLRPILKLAKDNNVFIYLDMETYSLKDITLMVFKQILEEDEFFKWGSKNAGIVIQAYLKDSENDLLNLIEWVKKRQTPVTVRLVKGAYWDYETITGKQHGWVIPVFENKFETDLNYEKLTRILLDNYPYIYSAIASHNIRSLAHAKAYASEINLPEKAVEYQFLYGMADPIKEAFVQMNERVRVYAPFGELIPGMAYLVRRLLENTANESFLRQGFAENINEDELLKPPNTDAPSEHLYGSKDAPLERLSRNNTDDSFLNEPDTDFSILENRELMQNAINEMKKSFGKKYPLIINGKKIETVNWGESINPSSFCEIIGRFALATLKDADEALNAALKVSDEWANCSVNKRAEILFKAAQIMKKKRFELAALMVLEEGKPWREADGDVSEAIDFLNYYSIEAIKLFSPEKLISPPGEENYSFYKARGIAAVISPWNFPLAILTGMSSAALITGNTVILKPSKQASIIAAKYMEILMEAGLPDGVCNYLPGDGRTIGNYLVSNKNVHTIAFTGSMEVGLAICKIASEVHEEQGQNFIKKVICEMGGKNAVIVDDDADLDEAVKGIIYSAFGYAGQKCSAASRVIVLKNTYEHFLERLVEAAKSIKIGQACDPASYLGPVIDKSAFENTKKYIEIGKKEGKMLTRDETVSTEGYFISPTIFADIKPDAQIAQEEIFAPVLAVIKADNFDHALKIANSTRFALTGGLFSRSPGNIQKAKEKFKVGNLYINRAISGAKVGRQPFGGFKMSGIGAKAGGKDYLLQFVEPKVITENTMRRGFAPD
ncbi:MAG: L-glutamate gamma-semialdehyde dehydrogenase [Candidatus Melainabacteria bacterium RIFCSPHIGHO2_02_FULL_34_12]|nr:MAG: L-glutamate gamma-semialdehyde dehydrogenase [Candidatus Melainabacteria bacterium RIFCSPHIGHO2_02_FULL_34_12]